MTPNTDLLARSAVMATLDASLAPEAVTAAIRKLPPFTSLAVAESRAYSAGYQAALATFGDISVTDLVARWQELRHEFHNPTIVEIVTEYAEWREKTRQIDIADPHGADLG